MIPQVEFLAILEDTFKRKFTILPENKPDQVQYSAVAYDGRTIIVTKKIADIVQWLNDHRNPPAKKTRKKKTVEPVAE